MGTQSASSSSSIVVNKLEPQHLDDADRIYRLAFGTFLKAADPLHFFGDVDHLHTRSHASNCSAYGAWVNGQLVGSNIASHWGSIGFFGPLTVHPEFWDRKIGGQLIEPVMQSFEQWQVRHGGLFTFAQSPKHLGLYQKFGFWPRFLTAIMSKPVAPRAFPPQAHLYTQLNGKERQSALESCREIANSIYPGLDLTAEIEVVAAQKFGDTVLIAGPNALDGFAVCHCGPGTEAGSGTCYMKFGAIRPGPQARSNFGLLLEAVEAMASARQLHRISAGVNTSRVEAYRDLLARGFRTDMQGVTMHCAKDAGYHHAGVFAIDDWR
jgi:GNAT superfamily N-acetyltransferase